MGSLSFPVCWVGERTFFPCAGDVPAMWDLACEIWWRLRREQGRKKERDETGVDLVRNGEGKEDYLRARFACPGDSG